MNKPLISILILTYNRTDLLKKCLDSVLKSDYPNLEYIISDNCSTEDIKGFIKKTYSNKSIKVYRKSVNKGLTGGFNFGYKYCRGKYVMLLCNDTTVNKTTITKLADLAEKDPEVGAVAPRVVQMKLPEFIHSAGSFLTSTGLLYHYGVYKKKNKSVYHQNYYIFSTTGAGFLVRSETIKRSGLFSEDFFMAYDESDLCHRIWLSGYSIVYCSQAELKHLWSATMDSSQPILWFWNQRNVMSSIIINHSLPRAIYFLVTINLIFLFAFLVRIWRGKYKLAWTLPRAYWWHLLNFKSTIARRHFVQQRVRSVSDSQIFDRALVDPNWRYYLIHFERKFNDRRLPKRVLYSR